MPTGAFPTFYPTPGPTPSPYMIITMATALVIDGKASEIGDPEKEVVAKVIAECLGMTGEDAYESVTTVQPKQAGTTAQQKMDLERVHYLATVHAFVNDTNDERVPEHVFEQVRSSVVVFPPPPALFSFWGVGAIRAVFQSESHAPSRR
jgi:hypothetical protein